MRAILKIIGNGTILVLALGGILVGAFIWDTFLRDPIPEPITNIECYFGGFMFEMPDFGTVTTGMFLCGEDIIMSSQPKGPVVNINRKEELN